MNAILILGDTALNGMVIFDSPFLLFFPSFQYLFSLVSKKYHRVCTNVSMQRFPWFRISYFVLLTGVYVIFEWIVHASVSMWYMLVSYIHCFSIRNIGFILVILIFAGGLIQFLICPNNMLLYG